MPKIKTHSGAKKSVLNYPKNGKVIRAHANKSHILNKKTTKRKRGLRQTAVTDINKCSSSKENDSLQIIGVLLQKRWKHDN